MKRFSAIVIEPVNTKRGYLYQAILTDPHFRKLKGFREIDEALHGLRGGAPVDVILISATFSSERIKAFIAQAKKTESGKEAAYIIITPVDIQTRENVASSMLDGSDGFLFIPFSVDSITEVAKIADAISQKFETERKKAALSILIPNITEALDSLATLAQEGENLAIGKARLKNAVRPVIAIKDQIPDYYFEQLAKYCENCPPRVLAKYKTASKRVQAMLERRKQQGS
ncbi:MAG TPA: hypothetical protein PJ989_01220 [Oligoflexia bacterium]|nr:hypothetical protein [Oligoflexia bacterium]